MGSHSAGTNTSCEARQISSYVNQTTKNITVKPYVEVEHETHIYHRLVLAKIFIIVTVVTKVQTMPLLLDSYMNRCQLCGFF